VRLFAIDLLISVAPQILALETIYPAKSVNTLTSLSPLLAKLSMTRSCDFFSRPKYSPSLAPAKCSSPFDQRLSVTMLEVSASTGAARRLIFQFLSS